MKKLIAIGAVALFASSSFAATNPAAAPASKMEPAAPAATVGDSTAKEPTKQQTKMVTCNKDAEGKKGDERKAFMKSCLSAKPAEGKAASPAQLAQREKMKSCNDEAKDVKGDARKKFMKECLAKK